MWILKKKSLVIIGARGSGKEVLLTINDCNKKSKKYEVLGFIDDSEKLWGQNNQYIVFCIY